MKLNPLESLMGPFAEVRPFIALKCLQRLVNMHPKKGKPFTKLLLIGQLSTVVWCTLPILIGVHGHIYRAFADGLVQEAVGSLYYSSSIISYTFIGVSYNSFGNRLWQAIDRIQSDKFGRPPALLEECRRSNAVTLVTAFSVFILEGSLSIYYYMTDKFCESRTKTNDRRYRCGYDSAAWFPFEEDAFVKEWILKLWWNLGELIILPPVVTTTFSFMQMLRFVTIRMQHLREAVEVIDETNIRNSSGQIKFIAKYYVEILECIKELKDTLGFPFFFIYTCSSVVLSLVGYVVILGHGYAEFPVMMIIYLAMTIFCHFGQIWEDEHEKLVTAVSNLPWYLMTPKMRKEYLLLLGTVQIPVHVVAQPHILINHNLLLAVTRSTYSVLTFLMHSTK